MSKAALVPLHVTPETVLRFDRPCPRYTSYPTADRFSDAFGPDDYAAALARCDAAGADAPLSIYVHLPFCPSLCAYCGCNVVVSKDVGKKTRYLDYVLKEIDLVSARLPHRRTVREIHLGGGTPNAYPPEELARLLAHLEERFDVAPDVEIAVELDPRRATEREVIELGEIGVNRLSLGVQDFDPAVQEAVGRHQSFETTALAFNAGRKAGIESINLDLIYGLPHQTRATFKNTIDQALSLGPDRIALFSFAYIPHVRANQRKILAEWLPEAEAKVQLFCDARDRFLDEGYVTIGMDHFARPDDSLAKAQAAGTLGRNFQGYTVNRAADLVGFGMTAIGDVGGAYVQNPRRLKAYEDAIEGGELATIRGIHLTGDDEARRYIIRELMCNFRLDKLEVSARFGVDFDSEYREDLDRVRALTEDGLVETHDDVIEVTALGQLFVRHVAACFDPVLHDSPEIVNRYSRAI